MSHRGRRHWNNDRRPQQPIESAEERLAKTVGNLGEGESFNATEELTSLVENIRGRDASMQAAIAEAISDSVTLLPHKIAHYATLAALLYVPTSPNPDAELPEPDTLGNQVLQSCWKACRESMAGGQSRKLRAWVQFFSHLTVIGIVSSRDMLEFLQNIGKALDELGASSDRLYMASLCIADGLLRAGTYLFGHNPEAVSALSISVTSAFQELPNRELTVPIVDFDNAGGIELPAIEVTECLVKMLRALEHRSYRVDSFFTAPQDDFPALSNPTVRPFQLESILLPPEQLEQVVSIDEDATVAAAVELQQYFLSIFDIEAAPAPDTPEAHVIRSLVMDLVEISEADRRTCAKHLVGLPRWFAQEVFNRNPSSSPIVGPRVGWQLESSIMEVLVSYLLMTPVSKIHPAYFSSLVCEMCKTTPSTFGPAVGKSFRKLHASVGEGLDVEAVRRFGDWFAMHMSNFGFQWVWKEWSPDLELDPAHPKRTFLRRIVDLEIRLAYYDRISRSLPDMFQAPEAGVLPEAAPGPDYTYSDPNHPQATIAREVLSWLQVRTDPSVVIGNIDTLRERLMDSGENEAAANSMLRDIIVQSLMEIGARSFSHFLNAIERYIKLMRHISTEPESKPDIFEAAGRFWHKNPQMLCITVDKLLQYQFAEPSDLIKWSFKRRGGVVDTIGWELIRGALDKAKGRVVIAEKKVVQLRKEHEDQLAALKAQSTTDMDVEDTMDSDQKAPQSATLATALENHASLVKEQKRCLVSTFEGFARYLCSMESVLTPPNWAERLTWGELQWGIYETWGWYKHFCRLFVSRSNPDHKELEELSHKYLKSEHPESHRLFASLWHMACGISSND